jgi:hypothetical protein
VTEKQFLLFISFPVALLITTISLLSTAFSIWHIGSVPTAPIFAGTRLAAFLYVMTGFTAIVLVQWIVVAQVRLERYFLSLWLAVIAVESFSPHLSSPMLLRAGQCAVALLSLAATFIALKITIDVARPLYRDARLAREGRESKQIP